MGRYFITVILISIISIKIVTILNKCNKKKNK